MRIIDGTETSGSMTITIGGEADEFLLTVVDQTMSPITGTITCAPTTCVCGEAATLTYIPELPVGIRETDLSAQWYSEGQAISGATSFTLSIDAVPSGTHRYDVVLSHPNQGSIGSTGVLVQTPTAPIVVNPIT